MSSAPPSAAQIAPDARWLAQALDPATMQVRLVRMTAEAYRAAAFLDDRMFATPQLSHVLPWELVAAAVSGSAPRHARWIFHIGHVGSTLLARLLGELPGVLSIREPRLLRDLMAAPWETRPKLIPVVQALMARSFAPEQRALVKATSFVSELAPQLAQGSKALLLHVGPRAYMETILAGPNSRQELAALAPSRARRMAARVPGSSATAGHDAGLAALAWACEMTSLEAAAEALGPDAALWMDFDEFLGDPTAALSQAAGFLTFPADRPALQAIAGGPLMSRYSKALEYDYSPALRRELLAEARAEHEHEIHAGLAALDRLAATSPLLQRALQRAHAKG